MECLEMDAQCFPAPMAPPQRPPSHPDALHSARFDAPSLASLDRRPCSALRSSSIGRLGTPTGPAVGMTGVASLTATVMAGVLTSARCRVPVASGVSRSPLAAHATRPAAAPRATTAVHLGQPPRQPAPPCLPARPRPLDFFVIRICPSPLATRACALARASWRTCHVAT